LLLKDKKLVWMYQKPFDILLKPAYRSDLRCLVDYVGTFYKDLLERMATTPQVRPVLAYTKV
jgi:hypothetical protein